MFVSLAICALAAQTCVDPPTPGAGFAVTNKLNRLITFSDGKTSRVDIRYPTPAPGACGWPMIVFVHGTGGTRASMATIAADTAKLGYCTVAYDVRGQGIHNGLQTHHGLRERIDLGEAIVFADASFPTFVDLTRVGVHGLSQGGLHAWMAAVQDGQPYPSNPWNNGNFPDIAAVVAENATPDYRATFAPQSRGVHRTTGFNISHASIHFDPAFESAALAAWTAEDWTAWSALTAGATHDLAPLVPGVTCPTMAMMAYDDRFFPARALAEQWSALAPGIARKLYLGTGGHSSPLNDGELAFRAAWRQAWFDRFLKGAANGIETGPEVEYAVTPDDVAEYQSSTSTWEHRTADAWPPPGSTMRRLYLHDGQALQDGPPLGAQTADVLVQTVAPGYTMAQVIAVEFDLVDIEANVPRVSLHWDSAPLASDLEYAGSARLSLAFDCAQTRWHVRARLCDVEPGGSARVVAGGAHFEWDGLAPGAGAALVELGPNTYVFRAGHRIRVELENLALIDPPSGPPDMVYVPVLHDFALSVLHEPAQLSYLELPALACPPAVAFGTGIVNSAGCLPSMSGTGTPSASSLSPFTITCSNTLNQRVGLLFYSSTFAPLPFYGGTLYVAGSVRRVLLGGSGGSPAGVDCTGTWAFDFNPRIQSGVDPELVPGRTVFVQCYTRDSALPTGVSLSDALQFVICP